MSFQSFASLRQMRRITSPFSASFIAALTASAYLPKLALKRSLMPESRASRFASIDSTSVSKELTKASSPSF